MSNSGCSLEFTLLLAVVILVFNGLSSWCLYILWLTLKLMFLQIHMQYFEKYWILVFLIIIKVSYVCIRFIFLLSDTYVLKFFENINQFGYHCNTVDNLCFRRYKIYLSEKTAFLVLTMQNRSNDCQFQFQRQMSSNRDKIVL